MSLSVLRMINMTSHIPTKLVEAERSFRKACDHIVSLNRRLDEMSKRYDRASKENMRSFRYSLRLRMAVTEGVRNMYYEYAAAKADEITELRCQARNGEAEDSYDMTSDDDASDADYSIPHDGTTETHEVEGDPNDPHSSFWYFANITYFIETGLNSDLLGLKQTRLFSEPAILQERILCVQFAILIFQGNVIITYIPLFELSDLVFHCLAFGNVDSNRQRPMTNDTTDDAITCAVLIVETLRKRCPIHFFSWEDSNNEFHLFEMQVAVV